MNEYLKQRTNYLYNDEVAADKIESKKLNDDERWARNIDTMAKCIKE